MFADHSIYHNCSICEAEILTVFRDPECKDPLPNQDVCVDCYDFPPFDHEKYHANIRAFVDSFRA